MKFSSNRADTVSQPFLDIHMDIFQRDREAKIACLNIFQNCLQAVYDSLLLRQLAMMPHLASIRA